MLKPKTFCHNGGIFFLHVQKKITFQFLLLMLNIEKRCIVINLHMLSESAYNIPSKCKHTLGI